MTCIAGVYRFNRQHHKHVDRPELFIEHRVVADKSALRAAIGLASMSSPPIFALRSTKSAGVISPFFSASSPYSTPTLSIGGRTKPWPTFFSLADHSALGSGPKTLIAASWIEQRMPPGFVSGL